MSSPHFVLLPHAVTALRARSQAAATGARRQVPVGVAVLADGAREGTPAMTQVELLGAADVTVLDPAMVGRVEPAPGVRGVEPNYFPYVEIHDADFPWRYSLADTSGQRAMPWIVLVALRPDEYVNVVGGGDLAAIEVAAPASSLPDLAQAWAWAHLQVDLTDPGVTQAQLQKLLDERPEAHFARLLCPRRLQPDTSYSLFLVPAYEASRLRGLEEEGAASPWDAPAWSATATTPVRLPVYRQWTFTTSASEDFESLVRRIGPADLDQVGGGITGMRVRAGETGHYPGQVDPLARFEAEGALRTPGFDDRRAAFAPAALTPLLKATLDRSLEDTEDATADSATAEDPLFALPAYGGRHAQATTVAPPGTGGWPAPDPWLSEANLDLRYRLAAGTGARVVRANQEAWVARCWDQVGELLAANRLLAQAGMAEHVGRAVADRHVRPLPAVVPIAHSERLHEALAGSIRNLAVGASLRRAGLPAGVMSGAERKVHAKRPARTPATGRRSTQVVVPAPGLPRAGFAGADAGASEGFNVAVGAPAPTGAAGLRERTLDWGAAVFPQVDANLAGHMLELDVPREVDEVQIGGIDVDELRDAIVEQALGAAGLRFERLVEGLSVAEREGADQLQRGPRIADPLYVHLAATDPELLCPGIAGLPRESAGLLVENRRFVEAYLLGANHEMIRELVWREFPTDLGATVFARMWERGAPPGDLAKDDVKPLASWSGALGANAVGAAEENLVLVLRAELVKRYPGLRVSLNRQQTADGTWTAAGGTDVSPIFTGDVGADVRFYGFPVDEQTLHDELDHWFVVIYEPAGRYRFGLDVANRDTRAARQDLSKAATPFPVLASAAADRAVQIVLESGPEPAPASTATPATWADLSWANVPVGASGYVDFGAEVHPAAGDDGQWGPARTSATLASVTFQQPARVVIAASRMVS